MVLNAHKKAPEATSMSLLGLFALAHWAIFVLFPRISDDYWYGMLQHDYLRGLSESVSWSGVWETLRIHFTYDNTRLGNIVFVFLQLLPPWLSAVVPAACVLWICTGICRFAGVDGRNLLLVAVTLLAVSIFPPWFENFFSLCFALNYLPPAAMMCAYVISLCDNRHKRTMWDYANALLLGLWHEAFGISLVIGSLAYIIATRQRKKAVRLAAWLIPSTIFLCTTAIFAAINNSGHVINEFDLLHNIVSVGKLQVPFVLYLLCVICRAAAMRDWRKLFSPWVILLTFIALTAIALNTIITRGERISTVAHIACTLGIMRCLASTLPHRWKANTTASVTAAALIVAILCWHYTAVIQRSWHFSTVWTDFENRAAAQTGHVFVDIPSPATADFILWRKPDAAMFDVWNVWHFSDYISMRSTDRSPRWPVPSALKHVTPTSGTAIPGDAGIRSVDGWLYMPDDADHAYLPIFKTRLGPFVKSQVCNTFPFTAADGRKYIFVAPLNQYFPSFLFTISSMDFMYDGPYTTSVDYPPFVNEHGEANHFLEIRK